MDTSNIIVAFVEDGAPLFPGMQEIASLRVAVNCLDAVASDVPIPLYLVFNSRSLALNSSAPLEASLMVPWQFASYVSTAWVTKQIFEELPFNNYELDDVSDDSDSDATEEAEDGDEDESDSDFEIDPNHLIPRRTFGDYYCSYQEEYNEQDGYKPAPFEKEVESCAIVDIEDGFDMLEDAQEAKEATRAL